MFISTVNLGFLTSSGHLKNTPAIYFFYFLLAVFFSFSIDKKCSLPQI